MTVPVINRRAERFAQLLDEAAGARRHHVRSAADASLAPLVAVGERVSRLQPRVELDPEFRSGLRAMLVATAERDGIGVTAVDAEHGSGLRRRLGAARRPTTATARRARARAAVIVGIAAGTLALSGMSAASGDAMPGDALYGIKRSTERAQLALAGSDTSRGTLYLEFAKTRVGEARAVRQDPTGLGGVLGDMDAETRQGVKLLTTAAVDRRDPTALDAVDRFVGLQRRSVAALLVQDAPEARERVMESLALLDAINSRTAALRTSLTCDGARTTDVLGPQPSTCGTAMPRTGDRHSAPAGVPAGPVSQADPTRETAPAGPPRVDTSVPAGPSSEVSPEPEGGLFNELGRILGGILG